MVGHRETYEWRDAPNRSQVDEIVIRFVVDYENAENRSVRSLSADVFRTSTPSDVYRIPNMPFNQQVSFCYVFKGGHPIRGWLHWRTGLHISHEQQIVGRVETGTIGEPDYWNYDGFMIGFGADYPKPTPDTPKPSPDIPPPDMADGMIIADEHLEATELFPFVYIKPWPKLASNLVEQGFMAVPTDVANSVLYKELTGSTGEQKLQVAVAFIDDTLSPTAKSTYRGEFVARSQTLPHVFCNFLDFPQQLRNNCDARGLDTWVTQAFESWDALLAALTTEEANRTLINIWNSVFAMIITTGYDHTWLSKLIRLLQVQHLLTGTLALTTEGTTPDNEISFSDHQLTRLIQATLLLPDDIFPVFPPLEQANPPAIQPYAVGAIRTVHYRPDRYVLGDVQRIEIVTQGETRQEVHRRLHQSETTHHDQTGQDAGVTRACDTTTADLINQVQKTLSDKVSATRVENYKTDYGYPNTNTMTVNGNWWVQDQPAGGYLKDISKFARDVVERSVRDLRHASIQRRKQRTYEEAETTQTRTLSNLGASGDRQTVYRWVNRQYKLVTKSSEDRLVFEIFLDVPSRELLQAASRLYNIDLVAPISPEQLGAKSYKDLSPDARSSVTASSPIYYLDIYDHYGIPPDDCVPPATQIVTIGLTSRNPVCETVLDIPPGYLAMNATATVTSFSKAPQIQIIIGGVMLTAQTDTYQTFKGDFSSSPARYASQLWASVLCSAAADSASPTTAASESATAPDGDQSPQQGSREFDSYYAFTLQVQCARSQATLSHWQIATFQKIQAAYQQQLSRYNAALKEHQKSLQARPARLLMDIVQDQIIQSAISLLTKTAIPRQSDGATDASTRDFAIRYAQFLRNAFDWEGMAVQLYQEEDDGLNMNEGQSSLISLLSPSDYFINFIRAKQARLMLSVKPSYARTLLLAFRTGEIWPCEEDITPCTAEDMNIVELLPEQRKTHPAHSQDQWTITLPTEMIALSRQDPFV